MRSDVDGFVVLSRDAGFGLGLGFGGEKGEGDGGVVAAAD